MRSADETRQFMTLGNGMALPCAMYVMEGIAKVLKENEEVEE